MRLAAGALLLLAPGYVRVTAVAHMRRKAPVRDKKAYDTSIRAFSPDGSIYQVEYALQAAEKGGLAIGVQTEDGLVLAAQGRRRSPLLKSDSVSKITDVDACMSCAMSGLLPDGRLLVDCARSWAQEHRFEFDEAPSVEAVALQLSRLALKFNGYDKDGRQGGGKEEDDDLAMSRPVGVSLLLAGIDSGDRPVLYHLDPSGAYVQWRAKAIGEKSAAAEAKLEDAGPYVGMTLRRAMSVVLRVLRDTLGDDFSTDRLEMVCVDLSCGRGGETLPSKLPLGATGEENGGGNASSGAGDKCTHPTGTGEGSEDSCSIRDDAVVVGDGRGGVGDRKEGSRDRPFLQGRGWFRRVDTSEMDALLLEIPEDGGSRARR